MKQFINLTIVVIAALHISSLTAQDKEVGYPYGN